MRAPHPLHRRPERRPATGRPSLTFAFADYGRIDGVNVHTDCAATLRVDRLHVGNANLSKDRVYLGATKAHPKAVPFSVHRRVSHS